MPKFCIPLEREVVQTNYVIVEAKDENEAREKYHQLKEFPAGFFDRWEATDYTSDTRISTGHRDYIRLAQNCRDENIHDHFEDDLTEDYLCSYSLPSPSGGIDPTRLHARFRAESEDEAEENLRDAVPDATNIYVELWEEKDDERGDPK